MTRSVDTLLIDLGNSRAKCALSHAGGLFFQAPLDLSDPDWARQAETRWRALLAHSPSRRDLVSCVTTSQRRDTVLAVLDDLGVAAEQVGPPRSDELLTLAYRDPAQLGVDRWLAMRAARRRCATPFVLACAGSALTIDAVDASGQHLGGVIAPSPPRALEALKARAAHLDSAGLCIDELADNTADAVWSGAWLSAAALVERVHRHVQTRLDAPAAVWISGGDAERIADLLAPAPRIEHDLVLRGLADLGESARHEG